MTLTAEQYGLLFTLDLTAADMAGDRHQQTQDRRLGISDIGGCPEYARRLLTGEPFTDHPDKLSAIVGKWVDAGVKAARYDTRPDLILDLELTATLPSGAQIVGHVDEADPSEPSVTDYKTTDGLAAVRRTGPTEQQRLQRGLYYLAAQQVGLIPTDRPGVMRNVWIDRAGNDRGCHVEQTATDDPEFGLAWVIERAEAWLSDVRYALKTGERAERTKYEPYCRSYCPFYSACRGADTQYDDRLDGETATVVDLYAEADAAEKRAKALKDALRPQVKGLTGITASSRIRTTVQQKQTGPVEKIEVSAL